MTETPDDGAERLLPRRALTDLPLGYQTIREKPLLSDEATSALVVYNMKWRHLGPIEGLDKPISKIVQPSDEA